MHSIRHMIARSAARRNTSERPTPRVTHVRSVTFWYLLKTWGRTSAAARDNGALRLLGQSAFTRTPSKMCPAAPLSVPHPPARRWLSRTGRPGAVCCRSHADHRTGYSTPGYRLIRGAWHRFLHDLFQPLPVRSRSVHKDCRCRNRELIIGKALRTEETVGHCRQERCSINNRLQLAAFLSHNVLHSSVPVWFKSTQKCPALCAEL